MEHKIITIAAIVFALVFVLILAVMMGTITNKANTANTQLSDTLNMTGGTGLERYDNTEVNGQTVIDACKNASAIGGNTKLIIAVQTTASGSSYAIYGYGQSGGSSIGDAGDKGSISATPDTKWHSYDASTAAENDVINSNAQFSSKLIVNTNGVTTGILFTQVA